MPLQMVNPECSSVKALTSWLILILFFPCCLFFLMVQFFIICNTEITKELLWLNLQWSPLLTRRMELRQGLESSFSAAKLVGRTHKMGHGNGIMTISSSLGILFKLKTKRQVDAQEDVNAFLFRAQSCRGRALTEHCCFSALPLVLMQERRLSAQHQR